MFLGRGEGGSRGEVRVLLLQELELSVLIVLNNPTSTVKQRLLLLLLLMVVVVTSPKLHLILIELILDGLLWLLL